MNKFEIKPCVKYEEDGVERYFTIGQKVVCHTPDREIVGRIWNIALIEEENIPALLIDTSVSRWSLSYEVVKLDEIEELHEQKAADTSLLEWYRTPKNRLF